MWYDDEGKRWQALRYDREAQDRRLEGLSEMQYALRGEDDSPTNGLYEAMTLLLPQIVYQDPRLSVESRVPGDAVKGAVGLRYAMESEINRQGVAEIWEHVGADFLAVMGITMVTMETNMTRRFADDDLFEALGKKGKGARKRPPKQAKRPSLVQLSPYDFCFDAEALTLNTARRMCHAYVISKVELESMAEKDPSWNKKVIDGLRGTGGQRRRGTRRDDQIESLDSDEVRVWEMWIPGLYEAKDMPPGAEDDPLYHGTIFTIAEQDEGGVDLRDSYLYRGPAQGPYQIYWGTPIPDDVERISLFKATDSQRKRYARHGSALTRSSENYKRVGVIRSQTLADAVDDADHDGIIAVPDISIDEFDRGVKVIEVGGPSVEMIQVEERSGDQYDRATGINENKRGNLAAGSTATEAAIANEAGDLRVGGNRTSFHRTAKQALQVMAWLMWHSEDVVIPLPLRAAKEIELEEAVPEGVGLLYHGGDGIALAESGVLWEDLMIDIVPYSMQRTSEPELRQKGVAKIELIKAALEILTLDPDFPIAELMDQISSQMNMPGLGSLFEHLEKGEEPSGKGFRGFTPPTQPQPPDQINGAARPVQGNQTGGELAGAQR